MITRKYVLNTFVTLCILCGFTRHLTSSEEIAEFQYPCYVDVCTFPRQFCNSDKYEKRCSPCSESTCKQNRIPLACKYQCSLINNRSEESSVVPSWRSEESSVVPSWRSEESSVVPSWHSETHGNGAASEMDNTVSNQSTISSHGGGTDAFKHSYCENKLKNVPPTDSGIQYTQEGEATAKVATRVSGFDDGKSRSEA